MKTASGHEFEVAWNKERLDVAFAVDPAYPLSDHWIKLTPAEARDLADRLNNMARICESRGMETTTQPVPDSLWLDDLDQGRYPSICAAIRELDLLVMCKGGYWLGWKGSDSSEIVASPTVSGLDDLERFCATHAQDYVAAGAALDRDGAYPAQGSWFWQSKPKENTTCVP